MLARRSGQKQGAVQDDLPRVQAQVGGPAAALVLVEESAGGKHRGLGGQGLLGHRVGVLLLGIKER